MGSKVEVEALSSRAFFVCSDLILEQLARNRVFLTDEGLAKLRSSFVIVVGCGGVGSHAAASLARSGVSKLRLIDFDQATLSSLNRHALATLADVGTPKVHCIRRRLEQITPWTQFDCRNELFGGDAADNLLAPWTLEGADKGLIVRGAQQHGQRYIPMLLERMAAGELVTEHFASEIVPLEDAPRAYRDFKHKRHDVVRPVFRP